MKRLKKRIISIFFPVKNIHCSPASTVVITAFTSFLFVFSEWIFIFTRPSFLRTVPFPEKLEALSVTSALLVILGIMATMLLLLPRLVLKQDVARRVITAIALLVPTVFLVATILLLVDNFTYTVFRFGIVSAQGGWRAVYAGLLLLAALYLYIRLAEVGTLLTEFLARIKPRVSQILPVMIILLAAFSALLPANLSQARNEVFKQRTSASRNVLPDILLITVDAVNAEYTSIYGGKNDTTPFLRELAEASLVGLNHFANAQGTIGSLTSLLTGKHPADTRVIYSSDLLQSSDAYQHLPGILKASGYYTVQLSNAVYADAYKTNFQSAFDEANGRSLTRHPVISTLHTLYPGVTSLFQVEVVQRITDRVAHIFYIKDMNNPYQQVTEAPHKFDDREKIEKVMRLLEERREPLFVHLHWMGTHGPNYFADEQVFSAGIDVNDQENNRQLFYFDSILEFDHTIADLYQFLVENERLENTLIIITSDHSQKWTNSRLPLLIHLPDGKNKQMVSANTENIDIAPTILDYLGLVQPAWMPGQSLITDSYASHPIFTAKIPKSTKDPVTGKVTYPEAMPPFYQFGRISVVACDQWFEINLTEMTVSDGKVTGYTEPCISRINENQALDLIIEHLDEYGFDTALLSSMR